MIQLIVGDKGKGKTKYLLENVNNAVSTTTGNIVYLDKNSKHMYELKNKIRLINASVELAVPSDVQKPDGQQRILALVVADRKSVV